MEADGPPALPLCGGGGKKRRFSDAQVRSLECTFESQAKLEPRRKAELAGELGLQPRQIAVWFQNRRARWKSKQLESEYAALRADYDALLSDVESVRKEKQALAAQLQSLTQQLGRSEAAGKGGDAEADGGSPPMEAAADGKLRVSGRPGEELMGGAEDAGVCFSDPTMNLSAAVLAERQAAYFDAAASSFSEQSCGGAASNDYWWGVWPLDM